MYSGWFVIRKIIDMCGLATVAYRAEITDSVRSNTLSFRIFPWSLSAFGGFAERRLSAQQVVVVLSKPVCFIANVLEESQSEGVPAEFEGFRLPGNENLLITFCKGDCGGRFDTK